SRLTAHVRNEDGSKCDRGSRCQSGEQQRDDQALSQAAPPLIFLQGCITACPSAVAITMTRGPKVVSSDSPPSRQRVTRMLQATRWSKSIFSLVASSSNPARKR